MGITNNHANLITLYSEKQVHSNKKKYIHKTKINITIHGNVQNKNKREGKELKRKIKRRKGV